MNFPNDVKYTKEHEWIRLEGDVAYVGITDYAQEQLGDIVFVDISYISFETNPFMFFRVRYIIRKIHNR